MTPVRPGAVARSRPVGAFVANGVLLVVVGAALAVIGWVADVDETSFRLWFRWSATVGVLLDLAVVSAVLARSVPALDNLCVLTAFRFLAVVSGMLAFGWSDGRSDPSYLLLLVLAAGPAAASVVLTLAARRRLRAAAGPPRR